MAMSEDDRARHHPLLSTALGLVLLTFFVNGFVRDARAVALVVGLLVGALVAAGLYVVSSGAKLSRVQLAPVLVALLGAILVSIGARGLDLPAPMSASAVGVVAGLLPRLVPRLTDADTVPLYVGAFAGMTSAVVLMGPQWMVVAGLLTGVLWSATRTAWVGIGGKGGTVAFTGVLLTTLVAWGLGERDGMQSTPMYGHTAWMAVLVLSLASVLLTHWLAFSRGWGAVLASAAPTLVVALLTALTSSLELDLPHDTLAAAWFGASFVGMTAPTRLGHRWMLPVMGLLFGVLLLLFQARLAGLGGDLGATAASAVIAVIGLQRILGLTHRAEHAVLHHAGH